MLERELPMCYLKQRYVVLLPDSLYILMKNFLLYCLVQFLVQTSRACLLVLKHGLLFVVDKPVM